MARFVNSSWFWPALIAILAWGAVLATLDCCGDHPNWPEGPGLTLDEPFNVGQGVALADRLLAGEFHKFREIDAHLADHPPLGRLWIGLWHELTYLVAPPIERVPYSITCARTGPAAAYALLVFLVGLFTTRWHGRLAGAVAALALVLMPRTFGHAHLAALETLVSLTCSAVVLYVADQWGTESCRRSRLGDLKTAAIAGVLLGLALLTKVQAMLLPVPIGLWLLWRLRWRAVPLAGLWGLIGLAVFFALWPYLWSAPLDHAAKYLGRTTNRAVLYVWYFGRSIADRDVPWHYPWVLFGATVPLGLQWLAGCGICGGDRPAWKSPRDVLVLAATAFPLIVFSIPGIAVYDGERLFANAFPLWAVLMGRGGQIFWDWLSSRLSVRAACFGLGALLATQAYGVLCLAPCWLSYYNLAVGGLPGAAHLGLEVSYWGDGLTRGLLTAAADRLPAGETIDVAPELYVGQWEEVRGQAPRLQSRGLRFMPLDRNGSRSARYVLLFVRPEYLPHELRPPFDERKLVFAVRRQGVILATMIDRER